MRKIILKSWTKVCALLLALAAGQTQAQTVTTIGGGYVSPPYQGYQDGHTLQARFNQPLGLALDPANNYLFVADYNNNVVRLITTPGLTSTSSTSTFTNGFYTNVMRGVSHPVSIIVDNATNVFVLNQGSGTNGTLLEYNALYLGYPTFVATNASRLANATAMAANAFYNTLYLTVASNTVLSVSLPSNTVSVVGVIPNPGVRLQGIAVMDNGELALSDGGTNSGIWLMNPTNGTVTALAGFNGVGENSDTWPVPAADAFFNHPANIAKAGNGILVIADQGNNRVKLLDTTSGTVTLLEGVATSNWGNPPYPGWVDGSSGTVTGDAESRLPYGATVAADGSVYDSEDFYDVLRHVTGTGLVGPPPPPPPPPGAPQNVKAVATYGQVTVTWSAVTGATSYNVKHSPSAGGPYSIVGTPNTTSFVDPELNGTTNYYVVSAIGAGGEGPNSAEVMAVVPVPPPPPPRVGWFDYEGNILSGFFTVLHPVTSAIFNNDQLLAVDPNTNGVSTYYTTDGSNPSATNGATPPFYQDGLSYAQPLPATTTPTLVIKAINVDSLNQASPITTAEFLFQVANPTITGANAAQFTVSDVTSNALLYYTLDGSVPTNGLPSFGPINGGGTNGAQLSLVITTNTLFKIRGFRPGYAPSGISQQLFSPSNFVANSVSFGTVSGEPHSSFLARPGQFYYAPVTLNLLQNFGKMYSLQFNVAVTNGFTNIFTGNPIQPIVNGAGIDFFTMLMTRVPVIEGVYYPPADGNWYLPIPPYIIGEGVTPTNIIASSLPASTFVNTNNNLLGVGWLFRTGFRYTVLDTNFNYLLDFSTVLQDLVQYSIAHDTLFNQSGGEVVVGAYSFQVPTNSVNGDQYFIQLGSPSATTDGVGAPGADIYMAAPAQSQAVTVASPAYLVGDVAPFHWLNAGDFGNTNLDNADVMQVYQSGLLGVNMPPLNSDLYRAMDSSGGFGALDPANGYYTNSGPATAAQQQAMWNGNDLTINTNAFGDGILDINDLYVTFRRSLDPSLVWFERYWTNGTFVAVTVPNYAYNSNSPHMMMTSGSGSSTSPKPKAGPTPNYLNSSVVFSAGDAIGGAANVVQVPLTANVLGSYPLRVLGLNVTVRPLDGSPAISTPVSFAPSAALGTPTLAPGSKGAANINSAWLNSGIAGLSNNASIGTLTVSIPTNATGSSAYAVHFDFVSGSPNGLAVFPKTTYTGLITTTPRTSSYYGDGIPDSWRLRWFGTVYNVLSASNACPSGDGVPNWKKYIAGVDPNIPNDFPSVNPKTPSSGPTAAIHWPSVAGKQYVIMRATSLFGAPWTVLSTNTGTGGDMEFDDHSTGNTKYYRVEILP